MESQKKLSIKSKHTLGDKMSWKDILKFDQSDVEKAKRVIVKHMGMQYYNNVFGGRMGVTLTPSNFLNEIASEIMELQDLKSELVKKNPYQYGENVKKITEFIEELQELIA